VTFLLLLWQAGRGCVVSSRDDLTSLQQSALEALVLIRVHETLLAALRWLFDEAESRPATDAEVLRFNDMLQ